MRELKPLLLKLTEEERAMLKAIQMDKHLSTEAAVIRWFIRTEYTKIKKVYTDDTESGEIKPE